MRRLSALSVIALFVVAAGCSNKSDTGTVSATETPEASAAASGAAPVMLKGKVNDHGTKKLTGMTASIELEADNFYFEPTFVGVEKGAKVTVELKNEGNVPHNFSIDSLQIDQTVQPEKTATVTVTLPSTSAPVEFHCKFHVSQGMQGAFYTAS